MGDASFISEFGLVFRSQVAHAQKDNDGVNDGDADGRLADLMALAAIPTTMAERISVVSNVSRSILRNCTMANMAMRPNAATRELLRTCIEHN